MEDLLKTSFQFEKTVLVQARTVLDEDLTDELISNMLGWAILNNTIWASFAFRQKLATLIRDADLAPTTRLFIAFADNFRLSKATLQRFVELYRSQKGDHQVDDFKICIEQRESLKEHLATAKDSLPIPYLDQVRRILSCGRNQLRHGDDDFELQLIDAAADEIANAPYNSLNAIAMEVEMMDFVFKILMKPHKSFGDQKKILERFLSKVDESRRNKILRILVEKLKN